MNSARSNASSSSSTAGLSFGKASEINARRDVLKEDHLRYIEAHPELKHLMSDFLSQVLLMKPGDVRAFAAQYFSAHASETQQAPLILCGPSGVGKGTLVKRLLADFGDVFGLAVSHTTRAPREGEENGVHYHFTDHATMQEQIEKGMFIEFAHVHGNIYGSSVQAVKDVSGMGKVCILEIDVQGVRAVAKTALKPNRVYIAPPSHEALEQRLRDRGTETEEALTVRLQNAREEMAWLEDGENVDATVVNDDLEKAYQDLLSLLTNWYPALKPVVA